MIKKIADLIMTNLILVVVTITVLLASVVKFAYCRNNDFSGIAAVTRGCYSDIPQFWYGRRLDLHLWPIKSSNIPDLAINIGPIEYPVLIGLFIWIISYLTPNNSSAAINFFDLNVLFLGILFLLSVYIINKTDKKKILYYVLAPPIFLSLFINWDMLAVAPMLAAVMFFDKKKFNLSAAFLAIAISAKFFPIVILLSSAIIFIRKKHLRKCLDFLARTAGLWLLINTPFMLIDWSGWISFFKNNLNRGISFGSFWEILNIFGIRFNNVNLIYTLTSLLLFIFVTIYLLKSDIDLKLAPIAFFPVMAFTLLNKVYSPQYVLWLVPLAVLSLKTQTQKILFVFWIFQETIYHLAIWRYIYWMGWGNEILGFPPKLYAILSLLRILSLVIFTFSLTQREKSNFKL